MYLPLMLHIHQKVTLVIYIKWMYHAFAEDRPHAQQFQLALPHHHLPRGSARWNCYDGGSPFPIMFAIHGDNGWHVWMLDSRPHIPAPHLPLLFSSMFSSWVSTSSSDALHSTSNPPSHSGKPVENFVQ